MSRSSDLLTSVLHSWEGGCYKRGAGKSSDLNILRNQTATRCRNKQNVLSARSVKAKLNEKLTATLFFGVQLSHWEELEVRDGICFYLSTSS